MKIFFECKLLEHTLKIKKQKVEPTELANDTKINPGQNPNKAPASKVLRSEIGNANAVTTT
jgi:hypothetical protein